MKTKLMTMCLVVAVLAIGSAAQAAFTLSGSTFNTNSGFPWSGNTNYRWSITTNGVNGQRAMPNQADTVDLGIGASEWLNLNSIGPFTLSGTVSQLPTGSSSYLQIGIITKAQADRAAGWYASGMFNNAAFINFYSTSVTVGETSTNHTTILSGLSNTDSVAYEVQFDTAALTMRGRVSVNNGSWTSWVSRSFGTDNWGWSEYEDASNFNQTAVLANMYNEAVPNETASTATFGNITAVPEPATMAILGLGALGLLRRKK